MEGVVCGWKHCFCYAVLNGVVTIWDGVKRNFHMGVLD